MSGSFLPSWDQSLLVFFLLLYRIQGVCSRPPRFRFAKVKAGEFKSYYTAKTRVAYVCRPGYDTIPGINSVITCLENYTWTVLPVFCKGKSCGDPGKPENGEAVILTDLLYLAKVNFICEEGYRLIGLSSIQCVLKGDGVEWQSKPPECQRPTGPTIRPTSKKITISPKTGQTGPTIRPTSKKSTTSPETGSTQSPGRTAPKTKSGTRKTTGIVVGVVVGVILLAAAIAVFMKCRSYYRPNEY
ncbi:complement decay-accelerating factor-like [Sceloporus undulatus]|uniref:complement decay-accelerating factor-like n=1 Tax=Sceloporus undulatus TaxID=8520 RepID=UPI001C4CF8ED|nr:complement decay-accelerating factor-like [Sceloporus undulatus]